MKYRFEKSKKGGFLYRFWRFISYPFRKPLILLVLLLLLFFVPVFALKVAPKNVVFWYKDHIIDAYVKSKNYISENVKFPEKAPIVERGIDTIVSIPQPKTENVRRRGFGRASETSETEIKELEEIEPNLDFFDEIDETSIFPSEEELLPAPETETYIQQQEILKGKAQINKNLPLKYLVIPEEIEGVANVVNSNSLEIGKTFVFLYGIYSNPTGEDGKKTEEFLKDTIEGRSINCSIIAYTYQDIATAICYFEENSINHVLVNKGLVKNVALQ